MKKLLLKSLAVLASSLVIYVGAGLIFHSFDKVHWLPNIQYTLGGKGQTLLRLEEAEKVSDIDILFIGSSQVYRGFDPRIFKQHGLNTFNLGSSAQVPFTTYYLLKEYLPKMRPEFVVLDLYWVVLSIDGLEAGVDIISNSKINDRVLEMVLDSGEPVLYTSLLISSMRQVLLPIDPSFQKKYRNDTYVKGGFTQSGISKNMVTQVELASPEDYHFEPAPLQIEYLHKIIALCRKEGVELMLTVNPVTKEYKNSVVNYSQYTALIDSLAKGNNLKLTDYNMRNDLELSSQSDFIDKNHLSQSGVEKFNRLFIKDFKKIRISELAVTNK